MVDKIIAVLKECDVTGSETWWWKVEEKIEALLSASDNCAITKFTCATNNPNCKAWRPALCVDGNEACPHRKLSQ